MLQRTAEYDVIFIRVAPVCFYMAVEGFQMVEVQIRRIDGQLKEGYARRVSVQVFILQSLCPVFGTGGRDFRTEAFFQIEIVKLFLQAIIVFNTVVDCVKQRIVV